MKPIFEVPRELAEAHRIEDPQTKSVILAEGENEVRMVEVRARFRRSASVSDRRASCKGIPCASVVVLLSKDDWHSVKKGELALPPRVGKPEEVASRAVPEAASLDATVCPRTRGR